MKKGIMFMLFCLTAISTFAQIQRKVADTNKIRGTGQDIESNDNASGFNKKEQLKLIKQLNLTRDQKGKLKEMRQANQARGAVIMNDASLTASQKQAQLKTIKRSGAIEMQGILNEAQKKKMKEMRKKRKDGDADVMLIEE